MLSQRPGERCYEICTALPVSPYPGEHCNALPGLPRSRPRSHVICRSRARHDDRDNTARAGETAGTAPIPARRRAHEMDAVVVTATGSALAALLAPVARPPARVRLPCAAAVGGFRRREADAERGRAGLLGPVGAPRRGKAVRRGRGGEQERDAVAEVADATRCSRRVRGRRHNRETDAGVGQGRGREDEGEGGGGSNEGGGGEESPAVVGGAREGARALRSPAATMPPRRGRPGAGEQDEARTRSCAGTARCASRLPRRRASSATS